MCIITQTRRGFTLVELSIVLVILGLLVGGVLTGQSLIRASELRSVMTQYNGFTTAVNAFKDKYFALPGDMTNATSFWGTAAAGAACATTAGTGTATCNGDGNGQIPASSTNSNEMFRFWQHLANAGLINGTYDGITHGTSNFSSTTANTPAGKISNSLWGILYFGPITGSTGIFDNTYNNFFQFGATTVNADPQGAILKPEELWNIDTKMDDGKPATGKILVRGATTLNTCTDTSTSNNFNANYLLSGTSISCVAIFLNGF